MTKTCHMTLQQRPPTAQNHNFEIKTRCLIGSYWFRETPSSSFRRRLKSSYINWFQMVRTPTFTGVTTFYRTVLFNNVTRQKNARGYSQPKKRWRCLWSPYLFCSIRIFDKFSGRLSNELLWKENGTLRGTFCHDKAVKRQ